MLVPYVAASLYIVLIYIYIYIYYKLRIWSLFFTPNFNLIPNFQLCQFGS